MLGNMKECRLKKVDLIKLNQIKRSVIKGIHKNVKEQVYDSFDTIENFLEFIKQWEHISEQENMIIFLVRILRTLERQSIFIDDSNVYKYLFKRSFKTIKLYASPKICEICFLIISKICNCTVRIIQAIYLNFDIFLFRSVYALNPNKNKEIVEVLHFLSVAFTILLRSNLFDSLLIDWWRFRFFLKNSINCLMDITFGLNSLSHEQNNQTNISSVDDSDINDSTMRRVPKNLQLYAIEILLELLVQRPELLFTMRIGLTWLTPLINQSFVDTQSSGSVLGTILVNILCKWLDSPIIRELGELKYIIQQLFSPLFSFDSMQNFSPDLSYSPTIIESCKWSFLNLLNTWPGLFTFFSFNSDRQLGLFDYIGHATAMNLYSEKIKICIIDLFCDLLYVSYARYEFSDQLNNGWEKAFFFYKRIRLPDLFSISLRNDFLLAEIAYLDSQNNCYSIDLLQIYQAVILYAIIYEKLPEALIRLILLNPDSSVSIKATFLLGDILYLSKLLPKNVRLETISINNLIHSIVESFYLHEKIPNERKWNSFLLIDRLNEINTFLNKPPSFEALTLINTFLIVNPDEFKRRRSTLMVGDRSYFSSEVNSDDCGNNDGEVVESFVEELSSDPFDSEIDILISKVFITQHVTSKNNFNVSEIFQQKLMKIDSLDYFYTDNEHLMENTDWNIIWRILAIVDDKIISSKIMSSIIKSTIDKCIPVFNLIVNLFLPSNKVFLQNRPSIQAIKCGQYCFRLLCSFTSSSVFVNADNIKWAHDMLLNFTYDFCNQINPVNSEAIFSSKNLLFGGSCVYFSVLRALSSHYFGQKLIEQTQLGQKFLDNLLEESASPELIKLSVVSLNYFPSQCFENKNECFARTLLENLLIYAKNIIIRKWCTRFVGSFFTLNQHYLSFQINFLWNWPLKLLFRQFADPSPKVVNAALNILLKYLYFCPANARTELREQLRLVKLKTLGDAGTLLEVFLFDEDFDIIQEDEFNLLSEIASNALDKWSDQFYIQYYEIIAEKVRRAMLNNGGGNGFFCYKRAKNGDFARASGQMPSSAQNYQKERLFPPPHLYGHLVRSKRGQHLLASRNIITNLECIICSFLQNGIFDDSKSGEVKGALFALAHILANLPSSVNWPIYRYTKLLIACVLQQNNITNLPWLTIKGCAIWAINIAATSKNNFVTQILFKAGWEFGESFNNNFGLKNQIDISNFVPSNNNKKCKKKRNVCHSHSMDDIFFNSKSKYFSIFKSQDIINNFTYERKEFFHKIYEKNIKDEISSYFIKCHQKIKEKENDIKFLTNINEVNILKENNKLTNISDNYYKPFGCVILPKDISTLFKNVFIERKRKGEFSTTENYIINQKEFKFSLNKKHCKWLCIFCSSNKKQSEEKDETKIKNKIEETAESEIRQLIYQMATQFSNKETTIKLIRIYKAQPKAFENRCLLSDVLNFIIDSKIISFGGRHLIYQLFWKALSNKL